VAQRDGLGHVLTVDFSTASKKIRCCFDLGTEYPFSPMNVCLEPLIGEVSVDILGKSLIRNVKPGYGYLLRATEVVNSWLTAIN